MKTPSTLVSLLLVLAILFGCSSPEENLYSKALASIEDYHKKDMHDPSSLQLVPTTALIRLDTISDADLFPNWREWQAIKVTCRGKNAFGSMVAEERVFFLSDEGICGYSYPMERLSPEERLWLLTAPSYMPL